MYKKKENNEKKYHMINSTARQNAMHLNFQNKKKLLVAKHQEKVAKKINNMSPPADMRHLYFLWQKQIEYPP